MVRTGTGFAGPGIEVAVVEKPVGLCLRVGLVGPLAPPAGGMALQTAQLAELLLKDGCDVDLVQTNAPYRPAWVAKVPVLRAGFRLLPYLGRLWRVAGRSDVIHLMANSGWSWHLYAVPAIWIARLRGTPLIVNFRGGGAGAFMKRSGGAVRASLKRASSLIVPSGFLQEVFKGHSIDSTVVPNIIDLERYRAREVDAEPSDPHLIVTRNLEAIYDNESAIRALALVRQTHPSARLTLAGSGPELERLRSLAEQLNLAGAVHFAGRLSREAMAELYAQASVMLNPSRVDNMPNSVLEALACAVPVVSTNVGGVPYLVTDNESALLVEPGRPEQMATAVRALLDDAALRRRLTQRGLEDVGRYTWEQVRPLLLATYAQARRASLVGRKA